MCSRQKIIAITLILIWVGTYIFAQNSSNKKTISDSDLSNMYLGVEGSFAPPSILVGQGLITRIGGGGGAGFGYNLKGLLLGIKYNFFIYSSESFVDQIQHHMIRFEISKPIATSEKINVRPQFSLGADIITATYETSNLFGIPNSKNSTTPTVAGGLGIFCEYSAKKSIIPYFGANVDFALYYAGLGYDDIDVFVMPAVTFGIRLIPEKEKIKATKPVPEPKKKKERKIKIKKQDTSPKIDDGKGLNLTPDIELPDDDKIKKWKIDVTDTNTGGTKSYSGTGTIPKDLSFGVGEEGNKVRSFATYKVNVQIETESGYTLSANDEVKTGIILTSANTRSFKFDVRNITFDPNTEEFYTLSEDQLIENDSIFNEIYSMLTSKKYKTNNYWLEIYGHANPTTPRGTKAREEEEINDLAPLSEARANKIRQMLIEKGVPAERITARGLGGTQPLTNDPREAWLNRRVEFFLTMEN